MQIPVWTLSLAMALGLPLAGQPAEPVGSAETSKAPPESPFSIRGTLPWHNFLSGPSGWNEADYRAYLDAMAAHKLNFLGLHCYTGGAERYAPYVEPMIRIEYRNVVPEAGLDTSLTARWGYRPLAVKDFAFETSQLFTLPAGAEAFGADGAITASTTEERYRNAHNLMRKVIGLAHARGIQVALGFEFGVHPPEFASIVPPESRIGGAMLPDPTHPANIEILRAALDDILREYPGVDWIWLWLHEHSMFVGEPSLGGDFGAFYQHEKTNFLDAPNAHDVFTGVWSLAYLRQAHKYLAQRSPQTRLVIGGWGGGPQLPPVLRGLDRALPTNIVFTCLNPGMGSAGHAPVLNEIAEHRPVWSIPWLEGDAWLWHLQLRAGSILDQVKAAEAAHLAGVVAIHWRTEEIRANFEAFALAATHLGRLPSLDEFYRQHCTQRYGPTTPAELAPILARLEREGGLGSLASPEFFPYQPSWGRMPDALAKELSQDVELVERLKHRAPSPAHQSALGWLADNFRFAILLDQVGRKLEPAYRLKEDYLRGRLAETDLAQQKLTGLQQLRSAPIEELFRTFARRVKSRGELGELSSLNQKLWLQYRELEAFLTSAHL